MLLLAAVVLFSSAIFCKVLIFTKKELQLTFSLDFEEEFLDKLLLVAED
jgi:hypothetical protein